MKRTLADAHRLFADLQQYKHHVEWNRPLEVEEAETVAPAVARRLDLDALTVAARNAGYASVDEALASALGLLKPTAQITRAVRELLSGDAPGAMARQVIARHLGVDELALWPRDGER